MDGCCIRSFQVKKLKVSARTLRALIAFKALTAGSLSPRLKVVADMPTPKGSRKTGRSKRVEHGKVFLYRDTEEG